MSTPAPHPPVIDARDLRCPLPVIRLAQAALSAPVGSELTLWATDPAAQFDVPAWCRLRGQEFLEASSGPDYLILKIRITDTDRPGKSALL